MHNVRLALRTLARTPFVSLVAILSLALGIGANSAIFSLFNQMLMRPLPVPAAHELVNLGAPGPKPGSTSCNQSGDCDEIFSYAMFRDLERVQESFTGIAAHRIFGANLAYSGQTESARGLLVSGSYFPVLGINPAVGRLFTPEDDKTPGTSFRRRAQPRVLAPPLPAKTRACWAQSLIVNGHPLTVIGVAPRGVRRHHARRPAQRLRADHDAWRRCSPVSEGPGFENRRAYWAYLFARLKPGVTIEQARVALNGPYRAIINDVEAPLQKGMSDQTMARFTSKDGDGGARGARAERRASRGAGAAAHPASPSPAPCC